MLTRLLPYPHSHQNEADGTAVQITDWKSLRNQLNSEDNPMQQQHFFL